MNSMTRVNCVDEFVAGVQPREDTTDGSDEVLTHVRSGVMRDSEVKHSPGLFQYSEMPSLSRSTPPRAFGVQHCSSEEDKNSVFKYVK